MRKLSWLEDYISFTREQESPEIFHYWIGLSCIAAILGRSVWLDRGYYNLYPNLFIVLVSPSGRCRKTTAANIGIKMLMKVLVEKSLGSEKKEGKLNIIMEKITPQALTLNLGDQVVVIDKKPVGESKALIYAPELSVFLGKEASTTGMLALLTSLYDCPDVWEYHTKTAGTDYLFNVWLGMVGCTAPEWLVHGIPYDAIGGGLTARIIFVAQLESPRKNPSPKVTNGMKKLNTELVEGLESMSKIKGELSLSREAEEIYSTWYLDRELPSDERFASFFEREHDHMLKVAVLLSASYGDLFRSNVVSGARVKEAIMMLEKVKGYMSMAFTGIGEHIAAKGYERVLQQIRDKGGEAEHSLLLRKNWYHFDTESFKKVIDLLMETNRIRVKVTKSGKRVYALVKEKV